MHNMFAENLYELRKQYNLKQNDLAKSLNTTQRKISYWESGRIEPDIDTLIDIANFFDVSVDELIGNN